MVTPGEPLRESCSRSPSSEAPSPVGGRPGQTQRPSPPPPPRPLPAPQHALPLTLSSSSLAASRRLWPERVLEEINFKSRPFWTLRRVFTMVPSGPVPRLLSSCPRAAQRARLPLTKSAGHRLPSGSGTAATGRHFPILFLTSQLACVSFHPGARGRSPAWL